MIRAKKKYGQNFLTDKGIINQIIAAINPSKSEKILEIGPGLGALTIPLLTKVDHIDAVEIDPDMIAALKEKIPPSKITIIPSDILKIDNGQISLYS